MERKSKMEIGCGIFIVIGFITLAVLFVHINKDLNKLDDAFKPIERSTLIKFELLEKTIFITTKKWGLGAQHSQTLISNVDHADNDILIDKEKEIVFDEICGFYYKIVNPDSLLIFFSSGSYMEEEVTYRQLENIKVKITKYKASMDNYYKNYQNLGLSRISCYDKIE